MNMKVSKKPVCHCEYDGVGRSNPTLRFLLEVRDCFASRSSNGILAMTLVVFFAQARDRKNSSRTNSVPSHLKKEEGYTLLETVVAMVLFLSALIPLVTVVGNFMLDGTVIQQRLALQTAEEEMCRSTVDQNFTNDITKIEHGLLVERKVHHTKNLVEVQITVTSLRRPDNILVTLNKTFLVYR